MHILISGAGITGPTLAFFLAKAGMRVTVVEKSASLVPHGQSIDFKGSAETVIRKMGLLERVRSLHTTERGTRFVAPDGRPFAPFPVREGYMNSPSSGFEILRGDLALVLYEATRDHPNVRYLFGTTVDKIISNDDDAVRVELSGGGGPQEFDLLVAADGQWSRVRRECFPAADVDVVHMGMYGVYCTIPRLPDVDDDWWNVYLGLGSRTISLRPDPHGSVRAMLTRMPRNAAEEAAWRSASRGGDRRAQAELLKREFSSAGWQASRILDAVDAAPDFYVQAISQVKMSRWSSGRVVCLGDAAYCPSPLTGMGTSLALEGAYVLAGELSRLDKKKENNKNKNEHPAGALDAFERRFRPFVEESQKIASAIVPGVAHPERAWARWAVQTLLATLSRAMAIPWLANRFVDVGGDDSRFRWPEYEVFEG